MNYIVLLFKNKKKKKILNTFKTERHAMNLFNKMVEKSNDVLFNIEFECGKPSKYEIGLLKRKTKNDDPIFIKDEMGRNIKLEIDDVDFNLVKLLPFNREELIFDLQTNRRITIKDFIKDYLHKDSINMVSGLNNKIITQTDNQFALFSLKTTDEVERFLKIMTNYSIKNGLLNIIVKDINTMHRKYLYKLLTKNGYNITMLYKKSTTHPGSKQK